MTTPSIDDCWAAFTRGQPHDAMSMCMERLQENRAYEAMHIVALSLVITGNKEGMDWCRACLTLADAPVDWFLNCGKALGSQEAWADSREVLLLGRKRFPDHQELKLGFATAQCHLREFEACLALCDELMEDPAMRIEAQLLKFFCFWVSGRLDESVRCGQELAAQLSGPKRDRTLNNLAMVLRDMGRPREGLHLLEEVVGDPNETGIRHNKALIKLGLGHWPEAWHMYQARFHAKAQKRHRLGMPWATRLSDLKGKTVYFQHEQGLGDCIQFIRYAHLIAPHTGRLIIGVPRSLTRFMKTCLQVGEVVEGGEKLDEGEIALNFLDAPALLDQRTDNIPGDPYLAPVPPELIAKHRLPLTDLPRVGLSWAGLSRLDDVRAWAVDQRRSMRWADFAPVLRPLLGQAQIVSLQQPGSTTLDEDEPELPTCVLSPVQKDWDILDTAAVVAQLDLVIAVDSAVMHLAAAMQRPTLMPDRYDPCWRWLHQETSDFYPTLKIYRQKAPGDWAGVVERIRSDLCHLLTPRLLRTSRQY